ncbi:UDP-glucose--hexose-1-phosphate uridylyltransferase [Caviibacter abscessus]|uniref:UDP-glucose--hexose-1-phosphate uridylyltransferase n=1 Tax=Caviibacter abscessus TaxID=1766719 RepID=UPI00082A9E49|nr:UDP-glucose--hexose-1-phosphate uridylyltransferase [Caviibacter abscessus]
MNIYEEIEKLILYSNINGLIDNEDKILVRNRILDLLNIEDFEETEIDENAIKNMIYPVEILDSIVNWAKMNRKLKENILAYEDLLNSKIMGQIIKMPSEINKKFWLEYGKNPEFATEYFYDLSRKSNYIRTDRIEKNVCYKYESKYGQLDITINLSKPEKDPKQIALERNAPMASYPKSMLCKENEGYSGRINYPGRQNHRIIKLNLSNEDWYFQYSPYTYYNEHSIVFSSEIRPMKIDKNTFERLIEFVKKFPHYFIGSNADLPIVGGSILSHDHFQTGKYTFAMEVASKTKIKTIGNVDISIVNWPMSVIRLNSADEKEIVKTADEILARWIKYNEEPIVSHTKELRHNTITPIARFKNNEYELDLVLRNNLTTDEYPLGIYHPHSEYHNIKKENIGLIEVMGLAVLPSRLKTEMSDLSIILNKVNNVNELENEMKNNESLIKHIEWIKRYVNDENIKNVDLYSCIGNTFEKVLEDCMVLPYEKIKEFIDKM